MALLQLTYLLPGKGADVRRVLRSGTPDFRYCI